MRDRLLLLSTALLASMLAWAFWHYLDRDAYDTLLLLALVSVSADNYRLRRMRQGRDSTN